MDAFAALKGTLAQGPAQLLKAYQALRRDRQAPVPALSLSAAAARRRHARPGRRRPLPARRRRVRASSTPHRPGSRPSCSKIPEATVTGWIAQTPALAPYRFPILDSYRRKAHVLDDKGERLLSLAGQLQRRAERDLPGAEHLRHQVPDACSSADGSDVVLSPGNYGALLENEPRPGRARARPPPRTSAPTARPRTPMRAIYNGLLQRDWFLAQARNFATHARRRARRATRSRAPWSRR